LHGGIWSRFAAAKTARAGGHEETIPMTQKKLPSPTSRAAYITYLMWQKKRMTVDEIQEAAGYSSRESVRMMMHKMSLTIPLYQPGAGEWAIMEWD
jgi:hypothetical protein